MKKIEKTIQPKTKEKLKRIIDKTIKEKGNNANLNFINTSLITDMSELFFFLVISMEIFQAGMLVM